MANRITKIELEKLKALVYWEAKKEAKKKREEETQVK